MNYETDVPRSRRDELNDEANRLRIYMVNSFDHIVQIGDELLRIKKDFKHGEWVHWVVNVLDIGKGMRTVRRYMTVAKFAKANPDIKDKLSLLKASSFVRLSAPNVPAEAKAEVMALVEKGEKVTDKTVAETVKKHTKKPAAKPGKKAAKKPTKPTTTTEGAYAIIPDVSPMIETEAYAERKRLAADMWDDLKAGRLSDRILACKRLEIVIEGDVFPWREPVIRTLQ